MSDATPRPTTPAQPTRQQLDDLEALMVRMLALPTDPMTEDSEKSAPPSVASPAGSSEKEAITLGPSPSPVYRESPGLGGPGQRKSSNAATERILPPVPVHESLAPLASGALPHQPAAGSRKILPKSRKPLWGLRRWRPVFILAPLVWFNIVFDHFIGHFGKPGRWLRQSLGRQVLGWLGLLMLAAALALGILDVMGWTR
jgi:hypothetical protein